MNSLLNFLIKIFCTFFFLSLHYHEIFSPFKRKIGYSTPCSNLLCFIIILITDYNKIVIVIRTIIDFLFAFGKYNNYDIREDVTLFMIYYSNLVSYIIYNSITLLTSFLVARNSVKVHYYSISITYILWRYHKRRMLQKRLTAVFRIY